jgi:hypothetical protein
MNPHTEQCSTVFFFIYSIFLFIAVEDAGVRYYLAVGLLEKEVRCNDE